MSESVRNIITSTMEGDAVGVQTAIHTAIGEKIKDALEAKRVVVAQNLVGIGEGLDEGLTRPYKRLVNRAMSSNKKLAKIVNNPNVKNQQYTHNKDNLEKKNKTDNQKTKEGWTRSKNGNLQKPHKDD